MSKRDYKSYNVLGEELAQQGIYEDNKWIEAQERDVEPTNEYANEPKNEVESIPKTCVPEITQDVVEVAKIEEEQKDIEDEAVLQPKKRINLGKKLIKNKGADRKTHQASTENNAEVGYISHANDSIDKSKSEAKAINKNIDDKIGIGNRINKSKNISMSEIQEEVDMTFSGYKNYYQTKERSKLVKWSLRLAKFILTMMLLPFIAIIAGTVALFVGGFLTAIVICVGTGVVVLGTICFMSTQVNASLIALGISVSVTAISFGGILFVLFYMLMKWSIGLFQKYKKPHKQSIRKEER